MNKYLVVEYFDCDDLVDIIAFELDENDNMQEKDINDYNNFINDFEIFGEQIMDYDKLRKRIDRIQMQRISLGLFD